MFPDNCEYLIGRSKVKARVDDQACFLPDNESRVCAVGVIDVISVTNQSPTVFADS